jgi:uncharacterized protein YjbI with pentapeptide repeats
MAEENRDTASAGTFRGVQFTEADFTGATFRACDLRDLKVVDSMLVDVNVSGIIRNFVVNDVDVTAFVEVELQRRHPERAAPGDAHGRGLSRDVGDGRTSLVGSGRPCPTIAAASSARARRR